MILDIGGLCSSTGINVKISKIWNKAKKGE